jgi:hypothetical protein
MLAQKERSGNDKKLPVADEKFPNHVYPQRVSTKNNKRVLPRPIAMICKDNHDENLLIRNKKFH